MNAMRVGSRSTRPTGSSSTAGPDNAVTAFDVANASLNDVVEAAHNLSHGDELLWSLAV